MELFSGALITMTGDDIRAWLVAVSTGQKDWYTLLPLCMPHPLSTTEFALTSPATSWSEFTCGWVRAATGTNNIASSVTQLGYTVLFYPAF